ncbi:hypothetical protein J6590_030600 [Homalodisca vitripennis]|nr:hypothetical protein J6590_030600 [Homalodisca vitripennis]
MSFTQTIQVVCKHSVVNDCNVNIPEALPSPRSRGRGLDSKEMVRCRVCSELGYYTLTRVCTEVHRKTKDACSPPSVRLKTLCLLNRECNEMKCATLEITTFPQP